MLVTALATPYREDRLDYPSYERSVALQAKYADALLAVGTTAEALLLTECEKKLLVKIAKAIAPRLPLFVGAESPCTAFAAKQAEQAATWGADGLLVAPPAFVKCTTEGFVRHVTTIAERSGLPVMLYNAPGRCGYVPEMRAWESLSNVAPFVKDAGSDLTFTARLANKTTVLCGNEILLTDALRHGAKGVVSVVSNVAPRLVKSVLDGTCDEKSLQLFESLANLSMSEVNPIAVKYMLFKKGIFADYAVRLPLTAATEQTKKRIDALAWEEIE